MQKLRTSHLKLLPVICLFLLIGTVYKAEARDHISDVLAKGTQWRMNVDGEEASLTLTGGRGGRLPDGGYEVLYEIDFGGRRGQLRGVSDEKNSSQRVNIELIRKNGIRVTCDGFVARETNAFMAGTCGGKAEPGAWYAVRLTSASGSPPPPKGKRTPLQIMDIQPLVLQTGQAQKEPCEESLNPLSSFKNRVDGTYNMGSADSVTGLAFPAAPSRSSNDDMWFRRLNAGLSDILELGLEYPDLNDLNALVRNQCSGKPIFCEIAYRQQAIYFMLGGK